MLKIDCRLFSGDRPCSHHKENGKKCDNCEFYSPIELKILIIKLDAMGDVLRTTSILKPLKNKYNNAHITWCTRKESEEILRNEYVNEVIIYEEDAFPRIHCEKYDLVINLDSSKKSSALCSFAKGTSKMGFALNEKGVVVPLSDKAEQWLNMSAFDDIKAANRRSYQEIIYGILGLDDAIANPVIQLKDVQNFHNKILKRYRIDEPKQTIGLNTGVGIKWPSKGWPVERWEDLLNLLRNDEMNVLLLGGPDEFARNEHLSMKYNFAINTGSDNSILEFAHIVNLCDLVVTSDSFALHIATALDKKVVALFGPTSIEEIYLYGKGVKLRADEDCKCYYEKCCKEEVSCMKKINADKVYMAIRQLIS